MTADDHMARPERLDKLADYWHRRADEVSDEMARLEAQRTKFRDLAVSLNDSAHAMRDAMHYADMSREDS